MELKSKLLSGIMNQPGYTPSAISICPFYLSGLHDFLWVFHLLLLPRQSIDLPGMRPSLCCLHDFFPIQIAQSAEPFGFEKVLAITFQILSSIYTVRTLLIFWFSEIPQSPNIFSDGICDYRISQILNSFVLDCSHLLLL